MRGPPPVENQLDSKRPQTAAPINRPQVARDHGQIWLTQTGQIESDAIRPRSLLAVDDARLLIVDRPRQIPATTGVKA